LKNVDNILRLYADKKYKECGGIYVILRGYVDIIMPKSKKVLHKLRDGDFFGYSRITQKPGYEFIGDLYAGLEPLNQIRANELRVKMIR
jgi:hypothetical protein